MISYSKKNNLLEQHTYHYTLQDVAEPNLYRELFDYDSVPKISFNHRVVPMNTPDNLFITDTTFRDGQQSRSPFTVKDIVELYKLLHKLGGPKGIVRQSEFFLYTDKDKQAVDECRALGYEFPQITSWIRANKADFELVKQMGIKETGILVSCSDYHIFKKMNLTRAEATEKYLDIVRAALEEGIVPRCHFEDITRADIYGFVVPLATQLMELSGQAGIPIKIRACDTLGYGVTYPGAALPRSVQGIIYGLNHYAGVPSEQLEWHGHNDFYKVVSNSGTAWLYGCSGVNCSMIGIGERTGNCPIEAMAIEYAALKGSADGMDLSAITEIAEYLEGMGIDIADRTPFVGRSFNATRAGIHADGMLKNEEIYNIFNTAKLLNRPAQVAVDSHSGLAGIAFWINGYYKLQGDMAVEKKCVLVQQIKELVDAEYAQGRNTVMGDIELDAMLQACDAEQHALFTHHSLARTLKSRMEEGGC